MTEGAATPSTSANGHTPSFQRSQSLNVHAAEYRPLAVVDGGSTGGVGGMKVAASPPAAEATTKAAKLLKQYFEDCKLGKERRMGSGDAECSDVVNLPGDAGQVTVGAKNRAIAQVRLPINRQFCISFVRAKKNLHTFAGC